MKRKRLIVKRLSIISSITVSVFGILLILYGLGVINCYDPKFLNISAGIILIVNAIDDMLSIKTGEWEKWIMGK